MFKRTQVQLKKEFESKQEKEISLWCEKAFASIYDNNIFFCITLKPVWQKMAMATFSTLAIMVTFYPVLKLPDFLSI